MISPMPNWIQILITIDRFLSISKPTKYVWRKRTKFQVIASIGVIIFDIIYYIPIIFFSDIPELYRNQSIPYSNLISICKPASFYNWLVILHTFYIPFIVIMIFTISDILISSLFAVLFFSNNAILFFINLIFNSIFRKEFYLFINETKLIISN